ncbi:MAG: sensor histidine kinase [Planctomycetota bacterium]|nr:MAG: sensor histidine kinase [Planctomycetota bacterium]
MVLDQRFAAFFSDRIKAGRALHGKEEASLFFLLFLNIKAGHLKASTGKRDFALTYFVFAREGRRWIMGVFLRTKKIVRKFLEPKISELQEDKEVRVFINYGKMKDRPDFVARQSLSYPLEDIYLVGVLRDQKLFHHLSNLRVKNYIFAITVAVVLMGLGTLGISYYLFREIQLAQMKSDFVSNVTHELKTPLTSIRMFVETILMGRVKDRQEELECLQIIEKETKRLTQLIEKILEFSSLENKIKQFQFTRCHLDQIIEESIQLFKKQIGNLPCHIEWNTIQKVQAVRGDRESLKEVLLNLFANAFKYCEEVPHIKVNLKESKKYVIVEVIDNGIGIPKKQWKRIFQKFYRVHNLLTSSKEGTGLGLAICKSIIQVHKGKILVQSKLGEGSKFSILLPKQKG